MEGTYRRGAEDQLTQSKLCGVADEPGDRCQKTWVKLGSSLGPGEVPSFPQLCQ